MVVKGYEAILGFAFDIDFIKVLLPAFGKPTSPTSAINLRSRIMLRVSPFRPMKLLPEHPPPP